MSQHLDGVSELGEAFANEVRPRDEALLISVRLAGLLHDRRCRWRPPKDAINLLLSFVCSVLTHDMASAVSTVGLDATIGFLHVDRLGRLS